MDCSSLPTLLSAFIDTFVDYSVSGLFLPTPTPTPTTPPPTHLPHPPRLISIGDLHGDLPKSLSALSLSSLTDPLSLRWSAGTTVAVQVGDVLDRGPNELRILYLLHRLKHYANVSGGALITLHGNHEIMNMESDFRFVTSQGLAEFTHWAFYYKTGMAMKRMVDGLGRVKDPFRGIPTSFPGIRREYWEGIRCRIAALRPGGPISTRFLSTNQVVVVVGDSVFVHGGLLNQHVGYGLERINDEVREWVNGGKMTKSPKYMRGRDALVWVRRFSEGKCDCKELEGVLAMMPGVRRMVMGHSIQEEGINGVCGDKAIRIDVGLSKGCGNGLPEVLEINGKGEEVRVLTANPVYAKSKYDSPERRGDGREGLALLVRESRLKEVGVEA